MDAMDEFQEADILWPDTARGAPPQDELLPFAPSEPYAAAGSASSGAPVFGCRHFEGSLSFFLPGAGASPEADTDEEEWQEADVLWPDTVDEPRGGGGGSLWPFPGGFGRAGRHVKPAAAARREGWRTGPAVSSPIDIPANVAVRHRLIAAVYRRL